ncbi:TPA: phage tail protein [Enterobacter kobei]|nr:phage tail protein [Enterobacter kobei]
MSQTVITNAFCSWIADRIATNLPGRPDRMVFAYIDGQDATLPVNPAEGMPAADDIRYNAEITQFGTLNENAFVSSVLLDTTIGDWDYNWIGLVDSNSNTVLMIVHLPVQKKLKSSGNEQGNTLTRNLVMEFTGAAAASQITVTAETWQIDFSARLYSMDESRRISRIDYYGLAAFQGDGFNVSLSDTISVAPGLGYIAGLRVWLDEPESLPMADNTGVWVDAVWSGTPTGEWAYSFEIKTATMLSNYFDAAGFPHYVTRIADITDGTVTDLRTPFPLQQLETALNERFLHQDQNLGEIAKKGKDAQKQARENIDVFDGTTQKKGLVQLTDLSKPEDESSSSLALTPAGLKKVADSITPLIVPVGGGMLWYTDTPPDGWLEGNGQAFDPVENPKLALVYPSGRVPDCRGYLIRGWDHGAGVDPEAGREIGSIQQDAMQNITGSFPADTREAGNTGTYTTGAFSETRLSKGSGEDGSNRGRLFTFDASRVVRTADETRGKNIATMIIFKTDKASADPGEPSPTAIVVTPQGAAINAGSQLQFTATVLPSSVAGDYPVSWEVSDSNLGSIDSGGLYVAKPDRSGNQVVIASVRTGLTVTTPLTQYIAATSVTISPVPDITEGETYHTVITMLPPTANEPLIYTSGNNDIASFSGGVVSGQGVGMAIITATGQYSGVAGNQTVTVTPAIVVEEYLKIDNNLSEIADNGPEAQQLARENIGTVGLLKRVVTITSSGEYVPGEDTRFVIFEAVGAGGGFPMTDAPAVGAKVLSGAGAGAYTKTLTQVPESRLFSIFIGATDASGNGGSSRVTSVRGVALYAQGGSPGLPYTSEDPEQYPAQREGGEGGKTTLVEDDPLTSVIIKKGGDAGGAAIFKFNPPSTGIHVNGAGGSSELGVGGYNTSDGKGPGYGGGASGFVMLPGYPSKSYPGGSGEVIAWEYA